MQSDLERKQQDFGSDNINNEKKFPQVDKFLLQYYLENCTSAPLKGFHNYDDLLENEETSFSPDSSVASSTINFTPDLEMDPIIEPDLDKRISLAFEKLKVIPKSIANKYAYNTYTLDLSHNRIKNLSFLSNFYKLHTLILDRNIEPDVSTFPFLPNLRILWLNNCNIKNLKEWLLQIKQCCPEIKQLSLMGNPGAGSALNGKTQYEHHDYRIFVLSTLQNLDYLDDTRVTEENRSEARAVSARISMLDNQQYNLDISDLFGSTNINKIIKMEKNKLKKNGLSTCSPDY